MKQKRKEEREQRKLEKEQEKERKRKEREEKKKGVAAKRRGKGRSAPRVQLKKAKMRLILLEQPVAHEQSELQSGTGTIVTMRVMLAL